MDTLVLDDHEDNGNISSESEASYTDSGIPASAEPITPSPMDFDRRISDHEDDRQNYSRQKNHEDLKVKATYHMDWINVQ
jgi:hypothetical protein